MRVDKASAMPDNSAGTHHELLGGWLMGTTAVVYARPELGAYAGVLELLDGFLDHSTRWSSVFEALRHYCPRTMPWATFSKEDEEDDEDSEPSTHLLDRIAQQRWPHAPIQDPHTRAREFREAMEEAAGRGRLDLVQWLHKFMPDGRAPDALARAAQGGHVGVLAWLHAHRPEDISGTPAMDRAAEHGHLEALQWLHAHRPEGCTTAAMDGAARNGHLDVLEWLHANRNEGCTEFVFSFARNGDRQRRLETLRWLVEHGYTQGVERVATDAIRDGDLEILRYLGERCTGSVDSNDRPPVACFEGPAMEAAVQSGKLEVVQMVHAHVPPPDDVRVLDAALQGGDMNLIHWLHETRQSPCSVRGFTHAARRGDHALVTWLCERFADALAEDERARVMETAAQYGHLEIAQDLHEHRGFPCPPATLEAALRRAFGKDPVDKRPMLRWLRQVVSPEHWTGELVDLAVGTDDLELVQWLHTECGLHGTTEGLRRALGSGTGGGGIFFSSTTTTPEPPAPIPVMAQYYLDHFAADLNHVEVIAMAAERGDLTFLESSYRAAGDAAFGATEAVTLAADRGHVQVLEWLHREPRFTGFRIESLHGAVRWGRIEVLRWWFANRPERDDMGLIKIALANRRDQGALEFLLAHVAPTTTAIPPEVFKLAIKCHPLNVLEGLCARWPGAFDPRDLWLEARRLRRIPVAKWLKPQLQAVAVGNGQS